MVGLVAVGTVTGVCVSVSCAVDVIGIMFQGPTLLQDSVFNATHSDTPAEESGFKRNCRLPGVCVCVKVRVLMREMSLLEI